MKVDAATAKFAEAHRVKYLELCILGSVGIQEAIANARLHCVGYSLPDSDISIEKLGKILSRKHTCPAYLANACLDELLRRGYVPKNDVEQKLVAVMFLTRTGVKTAEDCVGLPPLSWPSEIIDVVNCHISEMVRSSEC